MTGKKHRRPMGPIDWLLLTVAIICGVGALLWFAPTAVEEHAYGSLAAEGGPDGRRDWDALRAENGDVVAWLTVDGTSIDYPVMQTRDEPERYLNRSFWGGWSLAGTPFLDHRADADGDHALVFGHHIAYQDVAFTPIYRTWRQPEFDGIGTVIWDTPGADEIAFTPVFAMSVDKTFADIQRFDFADDTELRAWLIALGEGASAHREGWRDICSGASRVLTLVTCSSDWAGQRARTLLVCVA